MDGSFACPECGSTVEVEGLTPGRQVRCEFCQRLLEVPYLPSITVSLAYRTETFCTMPLPKDAHRMVMERPAKSSTAGEDADAKFWMSIDLALVAPLLAGR